MDNIMNGKELSLKLQEEFKKEAKNCMIRPSVAVIQIGDDPRSNLYVRNKEKVCNNVGIYFRHFRYDDSTPELTIINKIKELNNDEYVNGILLQLPIPERYNEKRLINTISNAKDVDGLTDINIGRSISGRKTIVPATPSGIMRLLKEYEVNLEGKEVVIVGKGKLVGKPLINLMLNEGATVTICHSKTVSLEKHTKDADVIVSAVGKKDLITGNMVKDGVVIVDVGISVVDGKTYGDVDFESVKEKASLITPVPGGVGPMTIAMLINNIMICYNNKKVIK